MVAFAALVAGATFAWLTYSLNVTNGNYNTRTMNFAVDYVGGTDLSDIPMVSDPSPSSAEVITVRARRAVGSAPGDLTIYLNTDVSNTDQEILTAEALNYAVCIGTCASFSQTYTVPTTATTTQTKLPILENSPLTASDSEYTYYNVYFWLDPTKVTNALLDKSYTGFISAEAEQVETR